MKNVSIKVYEIDELSEEARKIAYNNWLEEDMYYDTSDIENTLTSFCDIFGVKLNDYNFDGYNYNFDFITKKQPIIDEMYGERLYKYLMNNFWGDIYKHKKYYKNWEKKRISNIFYDRCCVLTGCCYDNAILEPIYLFLKNPNDKNYYELMYDCLCNFFKNCVLDYKYMTSEEYFIDSVKTNEIMFFENGTMYSE